MFRILVLCLCMLMSSSVMALAGDASGNGQVAAAREGKVAVPSEAREMSGISIVGNDEAPKSLYIVPWKSSDVGAQTSLDPMLTGDDVPVDREVFRRRIEFYRISTDQ